MGAKQQDAATAITWGKELCFRRQDESAVAADLRSFLDSSETQRLIRELMSDASLLAQANNGPMSDPPGGEVSPMEPLVSPRSAAHSDVSHPGPRSRELGSECPRQRPGSLMEAHAPFTPTVIPAPATVQQDASRVQPPIGQAWAPIHRPQHNVQGGQLDPASVHQTPSQPNQCQAPPPTERGFLGNKRKPKTNFTREQLELLEMTFAHSHYPSSVMRSQLSYASHLPLKAIQTWFQNRRVRHKKKFGEGTATQQSRRSLSFDSASSGSSSLSPPVKAHLSSEYVPVFPKSQVESSGPAGQFLRHGYQPNTQPDYQGVDYGYGFQSQLAGSLVPDQCAISRDWYQRQQPMGIPPARWGAVSPWGLRNAGQLDPSWPPKEDIPLRGAQQYWGSPVMEAPFRCHWQAISQIQSDLSMTPVTQHPVAPPSAASLRQPPGVAMLPQYQPLPGVNQVSRQCASPEKQGFDLNRMHPQCTSYPHDTPRYAAPNGNPQGQLSAAFPRPGLTPGNVRNFQDNHSYPMPKSCTQRGYSDGYSAPTLLSYHHSDSYAPSQVNPSCVASSQSQTSSQSYLQCPASADSPPCSSPDGAPTDTPTMQCQFLPPATPPSVALAVYGDSQPCGQFPTQPVAVPRELYRACDNLPKSTADEPLESPSTPLSVCSFSSCKTLYIDLDAETD